MAAGAFTLYHNGHLKIQDGTIDLNNDTIVAVLLTSSYTPNQATHSTFADISTYEVTDPDYARQTVAGMSITQSAGTVSVDCSDISFGSNVTITAKYIAFVHQAGASLQSADLLIAYVDLDTSGGSVSSTNGSFTVQTPNGLYDVALT